MFESLADVPVIGVESVDLDKRYERAHTISKLSSGWQLRHPLQVRQLELQCALAKRYCQPVAVHPPEVTPDPEALSTRLPVIRTTRVLSRWGSLDCWVG